MKVSFTLYATIEPWGEYLLQHRPQRLMRLRSILVQPQDEIIGNQKDFIALLRIGVNTWSGHFFRDLEGNMDMKYLGLESFKSIPAYDEMIASPGVCYSFNIKNLTANVQNLATQWQGDIIE